MLAPDGCPFAICCCCCSRLPAFELACRLERWPESDGIDAMCYVMALMLCGDPPAGQLVSLRPFCGLSELIARPSGLCFDNQGNLYVTCMTSRVSLRPSPWMHSGGRLLCVLLLNQIRIHVEVQT